MTLQDVADYLNCHYGTVYRLIRSGDIPAFRLGGNWRFMRSEIEKWIADRQARPYVHGESGRRGRGNRGPKAKG
jgi:excisionase family DNA binding protein